MGITDLIIPPWARIAAIAVGVALVFGAGYKSGHWVRDKTAVAEIATAKRETADLRAAVSTSAATQAAQALQVAAKQATTTQEVIRDSTTRSRALDQRIAAGGLRLGAADHRSTCHLPAVTSDTGVLADAAAQSVPAGDERVAGEVPGSMDTTVQSAARDAQQLAELIGAACKLGLCGQSQ